MSAVRADRVAGRELADAMTERLRGAPHAFGGAQRVARELGAKALAEGRARFGWWAPELAELGVPPERVSLELFTPLEPLDPAAPPATARFRRTRVPLESGGGCLWAVVDGVRAGRRDALGTLYTLRFVDDRGREHTRQDALAASLPFGAFAPAELYDLAAVQAGRADAGYFAELARSAVHRDADGIVRVPPPANLLQLHVPTATGSGTLAALARRFRALGEGVRRGQPATPADAPWLEFDAVQPLPLEPIIEYEAGPRFWVPVAPVPGGNDALVEVALRRPDMTDWGYDVVLTASSAVNPALLEGGRPDELVDLAVALHTFPGRPMRLVLDVVFGHTDNQALGLLDPRFVRGPNMYGQDVNQQDPWVRALLLEMQRRKVNLGADGVRVDGAQDLKVVDAVTGETTHDDDYLEAMGALVQEVAGVRYRPWMVFEDGRPWPREDWPTASTYLDVIERQPHAFQWGPITFAHNTPALRGFWRDRWWRVEQIAAHGSHWISGCANHDTVRRGTQVDPAGALNRRLGGTLKEVLARAYDHPAATLLWYAALPGVPMDFLQALARAPWGFLRNTDDRFGVKILAEEAGFFEWQVTEADFLEPTAFPRLKARGVASLDGWRAFLRVLAEQVAVAQDDLVTVARRVGASGAAPADVRTPADLKDLVRAAMDDMHAFCVVEPWLDRLDAAGTGFDLRARRLRRARPWLRDDLRRGESVALRADAEARGATVVESLRRAPDGGGLWLLANLEGETVTLPPPAGATAAAGGRVVLASPGAQPRDDGARWRLPDGEGVVFETDGGAAG